MERRIILGIIAFAVAAIMLGTLWSGGSHQRRARHLPWQVTQTAGGSIRVFGVTLEKTTLEQIQQQFGYQADISLFAGKGRIPYEVEAYFDHVTLDGLSGNFIFTMALSQATLEKMFNRGARIAKLGSGVQKVTLSGDDMERVLHTPVATVTYLPNISLDPGRIAHQFGPPHQRVAEKGSGMTHWLYPKLGLDIALDAKGKEVFQYVPPRRFEALVVKPLTAAPAGGARKSLP